MWLNTRPAGVCDNHDAKKEIYSVPENKVISRRDQGYQMPEGLQKLVNESRCVSCTGGEIWNPQISRQSFSSFKDFAANSIEKAVRHEAFL